MRRKFTVEQVVEAVKESRGLMSTAAVYLGCSLKTVQRYSERYPEVADEIAHQKELMLDVAESKLYSAVDRGEAWAICFFLKCKGKGRHYSERMEVTGADGKPIPQPQIVVMSQGARAATQQIISGARTMLPTGTQN